MGLARSEIKPVAHHNPSIRGKNCRPATKDPRGGHRLQLALKLKLGHQAYTPSVFSGKVSNKVNQDLIARYSGKLSINRDLTRALVSFQASKATPFYRWLKYREAFSSEFVEYVFDFIAPSGRKKLRILDPFAGSGTTLSIAAKREWNATGIELLPVGAAALRARYLSDLVDISRFETELDRLRVFAFRSEKGDPKFPHIRITQMAFPSRTEAEMSAFLRFLPSIEDNTIRELFRFSCLSILEDISYTRKDGQYLRWDHRSGRTLKSTFSKGPVVDFPLALISKLELMLGDLRNRNGGTYSKNVRVFEDSCLNVLPTLPDDSVDLVLTSPPYCNRYDYTRTYALELAFLGLTDDGVKTIRQRLLSCTVENRSKLEELRNMYASFNLKSRFEAATRAFEGQRALTEILDFLNLAKKKDELNNSNIPSLVSNYFFEMNLVIKELARTLVPGGRIVMVNDNVQYQGREIPVDLILSDFAEKSGLIVDSIWVLPRGKGNSSQQMGVFGRTEIRKCVYIWSKPSQSS